MALVSEKQLNRLGYTLAYEPISDEWVLNKNTSQHFFKFLPSREDRKYEREILANMLLMNNSDYRRKQTVLYGESDDYRT
jgi:hypothetical protein